MHWRWACIGISAQTFGLQTVVMFELYARLTVLHGLLLQYVRNMSPASPAALGGPSWEAISSQGHSLCISDNAVIDLFSLERIPRKGVLVIAKWC